MTKSIASNSDATAGKPAPWQRECLRRMLEHVVLKTLGICLVMTVFFSAYFHLLRHPNAVVTVMPLTDLDRAVALAPAWVWAYLSLWVYVGLPAGLAVSLRGAARYGLWASALCLAGLACFYVFPTAVPSPDIQVDLAQHPAFAMLQGVDASGNACPSLHVATAVLACLWLDHQFRGMGAPRGLRFASWVWMLLIVWSTLATKQHVAVDALAGAALGCLFGWLGLRWRHPLRSL